MQSVPAMQIRAHNDALTSENRIHSDDIALKYGFTGALVSGVNVFGYLSQPLVQTYGADWLGASSLVVRFLKPAYHNDLLTISTRHQLPAQGERHHVTEAHNAAGTLLAILESWRPDSLPPVNEFAQLQCQSPIADRPEISWDLIHLQRPAPDYHWRPQLADNMERIAVQRDSAVLYQGENGCIHPYYLLDACNKALMRMFVLPAWIHTGSQLLSRKPLRVGQTITVRALPIQKWEHKGHQFLKLYISMWLDGEVALEVEHTAIFRIAN